MNYRRLFVENSFVHLVIVTYKRKLIFINNIELLRAAFRNAKKYFDFDIIAVCVLPDHFHMIINPTDIHQYPKIVTSIKYYFSKNFSVGVETPTYGYLNKTEKGIFQRRYYERTIQNEIDLENQINYIHYNPIKHNLAKNVKDWECSSFHKFVKDGFYEANWGSVEDVKNIQDLVIE